MKAVTFIHGYIRGAQIGIQASHSIVRLMYEHASNDTVQTWAGSHETMVWLNGGDSSDMEAARVITSMSDCPYSVFHEEAMDNVMTAITVVVPENILKASEILRRDRTTKWESNPFDDLYHLSGHLQELDYFTREELEMAVLLSKSRLASI